MQAAGVEAELAPPESGPGSHHASAEARPERSRRTRQEQLDADHRAGSEVNIEL